MKLLEGSDDQERGMRQQPATSNNNSGSHIFCNNNIGHEIFKVSVSVSAAAASAARNSSFPWIPLPQPQRRTLYVRTRSVDGAPFAASVVVDDDANNLQP